MKKLLSLSTCFALLVLCSCAGTENSDTRFLLDTVVTLSASCDQETLDGAFLLCEDLEKQLSATKEESDVYKINHSSGEVKVKKSTASLIKKSLYYAKLSGGKFDITIYPVSRLWDFKNEVVPNRDEISEALKNVDYEGITLNGTSVSGGKQIDLGGIAKGYIADRLLEYFKEKNVKEGLLNVGGSIVAFGDREYKIGIKKPFGEENELSATVKVKNKAMVTAGVYERCFKKDGVLYHHILDVSTGFPAESDLYSATIISKDSLSGDALSTTCVLLGKEKAKELIESAKDTEAVFIDKTGEVSYTSGIKRDGDFLVIK